MSRAGITSTAEPVEIGGVRLSHSTRVLYPNQGLSKRDVAEYYEEIADWILPFIKDRPLSVVRCPKGLDGDCFFQKHLEKSLPEALRGIRVKEKESGTATYIGVDDVKGLISLVQFGVLEIHPWGSRRDRLDRPDRINFDLDPGPGRTWNDVRHAAGELHDLLDQLGLENFARTTGGKGLHVVVPITRRQEWDEVKGFAKAVADAMVRRDPDRYIATASKSKRTGRIYIDYLRNSRGATAIASYSTRARKGAPVATPFGWDELNSVDASDAWTVSNLRRRLSMLGEDPWKEFSRVRQSITDQMLRSVR